MDEFTKNSGFLCPYEHMNEHILFLCSYLSDGDEYPFLCDQKGNQGNQWRSCEKLEDSYLNRV